MAYTPTLDDINEIDSAGYKPTLQDINEMDAQSPANESAWQKIKDVAGGALNSVIPSPYLVQQFAKAHPIMSELTMPGSLGFAMMPDVPSKIPVGDPNSGYYTAGEVVGMAPAVLSGGAGLARLGISGVSALPNLLKGASNLAEDIPGVSKALDLFTSRGSDNAATDFVNNLLHGETLSTAHQPIVDEIRSLGQSEIGRLSDRYNNFFDLAANRGYLPNDMGDIQYKTIDTPKFDNKVNVLTQIDSDIGDAYQAFTDNPNVQNAHDFQSKLGEIGSNLRSSIDSTDRKLGKNVLDSRRDFITEMKNSLTQNGDSDLANLYGDISNDYKQSVLPFLNTNTIRNIVTGQGLDEINPINIHNVLKKDQGDINYIKNLLSPESNDLILAKAMGNRAAQGVYDPSNVLNNFNALDQRGFGSFIQPGHEDAIQNILDIQKKTNFANNAAKWAPIVGGGILGTSEILRRMS